MGAKKGNLNAAKGKMIHDAIRKFAVQDGGARLKSIVEALFREAENGNVAAFKEIGDRLDGKSVQPLSQEGGQAFVIQVIR